MCVLHIALFRNARGFGASGLETRGTVTDADDQPRRSAECVTVIVARGLTASLFSNTKYEIKYDIILYGYKLYYI